MLRHDVVKETLRYHHHGGNNDTGGWVLESCCCFEYRRWKGGISLNIILHRITSYSMYVSESSNSRYLLFPSTRYMPTAPEQNVEIGSALDTQGNYLFSLEAAGTKSRLTRPRQPHGIAYPRRTRFQFVCVFYFPPPGSMNFLEAGEL